MVVLHLGTTNLVRLSLQNDLDQLQTWSENSGLKFNASKCNSQMITRKLKPTTHVYKLNNSKLIQTDCERDLGVFVDRNLTWNRQVIEQSSKGNFYATAIRKYFSADCSSCITRALTSSANKLIHVQYHCNMSKGHLNVQWTFLFVQWTNGHLNVQ